MRDRIVAEYSIYAAVGRMDAQTLGLSVPYYDPFEHYEHREEQVVRAASAASRPSPTNDGPWVKVTIIKLSPNQSETCTLTVC